jgi:hypothetical protein
VNGEGGIGRKCGKSAVFLLNHAILECGELQAVLVESVVAAIPNDRIQKEGVMAMIAPQGSPPSAQFETAAKIIRTFAVDIGEDG